MHTDTTNKRALSLLQLFIVFFLYTGVQSHRVLCPSSLPLMPSEGIGRSKYTRKTAFVTFDGVYEFKAFVTPLLPFND